jgi:hypothetical protein
MFVVVISPALLHTELSYSCIAGTRKPTEQSVTISKRISPSSLVKDGEIAHRLIAVLILPTNDDIVSQLAMGRGIRHA